MGGILVEQVRILVNRLFVVVFIGFLSACSVESEDENAQGDDPGTVPGINVTGVSLSGTIDISDGSIIDFDVNDPNASFQSNDSLELAQTISNPATIGGYVNLPGEGQPGRSQENGDLNDFYITQLLANQTVNLNIADFNTPQPGQNSVALFLLDSNGNVLQHTTGQNQISSISVNADGVYYLRVFAISGASKYILTVGLSSSGNELFQDDLRNNLDFVPGEVIVEFDNTSKSKFNVSGKAAVSAEFSMNVKAGSPARSVLMSTGTEPEHKKALSTLGIATVNRSSNSELNRKLETIEIVKKLRRRSDVRSARLNYIRQASAIPNDEYYDLQWHYPQINLEQAWGVSTGSTDVIVAVVDTGVLLDHPDLNGQLVPGFDFIRDAQNAGDGDGIDDDPYDVGDDLNGNSSFHGTHVSGTIAAATNNGTGIAGIAWNSKIMPLRVLGRFGGTDYDIEQAVRYAAGLPNDSGTVPAQKASVINLSLGGPTNNTVPPEAFRLAREAGVIIVAAAGNESSNGLNYPASLDGVVSVSAVAIDKTLAGYSNFGQTIDIAAPGGEFADLNGDGFVDGVLSTIGSDANNTIQFLYSFNQGTSMASPHVAGVAALMKSIYPELTPSEFDRLIEAEEVTEDLGANGRDNQFGYGLIDAFKAVNAASELAEVPLEPLPPVAEVSPTALNFGTAVASQVFNISNGGEGNLEVINIANDSNGWLTVFSDNIDENGLGQYSALVNRDLLPTENQTYNANITVTTTANTVVIPVIMQVFIDNVDNDAGLHYVLLLDSLSANVVQKIVATKVGESYRYVLDNVSPGTYKIMAGTDTDNDGILCEAAEACGVYLFPSHVVDIIVDDASGNQGGLNFTTKFGNLINAGTELPVKLMPGEAVLVNYQIP